MKIFPAIDIRYGKAVRLYKGNYSEMKVYDDSPVEVAKRFYNAGARNLHIVDLDGAKDGVTHNFGLVEQIVSATKMFCEIGGGIRTMESIDAYLNSGADRVILGTAALNNRALLEKAVSRYSAKIAVGVDAKNGFAAADGWEKTTDIDGIEFCKELRDMGVKSVIYTDISKDGTLTGTNMAVYEKLSQIDGLAITASGGISFLEEIDKLASMGIDSAILGKAIYENVIDLSAAIARAGGQA